MTSFEDKFSEEARRHAFAGSVSYRRAQCICGAIYENFYDHLAEAISGVINEEVSRLYRERMKQ